jgi:diguanylate cyclase (GGDEF)-like protein
MACNAGTILDLPKKMKLSKQLGWFWSLVPLALLGFALEALVWSRDTGAGPLLRPIWFGLLCTFCFLLAVWYEVYDSARKAEAAQQLLASVLDTLDVGLEIWDAQDRLLLYNQQINRMRIDFRTPDDIGKPFSGLARARLAKQQIVAAIGREDEWLDNRLQMRGKDVGPQLKEYAGDQWFRMREQRTAGGYLVTSWIDVTDLVRKERQLHDQNVLLQRQSDLDALTGLSNRRSFDEALTTELARGVRTASPISLLMIDIDHFKLYNDRYGHVAGDECLQAVADVLRRCVRRAGEIVARYGGEEFVLLLPSSDEAHAIEVAQNCMDLLRQRSIKHESSATSTLLTCSIGVACATPTSAMPPYVFINAADTAMYRAKMAGRAGYKVAQHADWVIDKDTPRTIPAELKGD